MGKIIGIDLGTTNSCVAVLETNSGSELRPTVIPNEEGARTTPSMVAVSAKGDRLVGHVAKRQAVTNSERTIYAVKRLMGRKFRDTEVRAFADGVSYPVIEAPNGDAWVKFGDKAMSPPEVSSLVLRKMKEIAEVYLGEEVTEAVITVPAYFDEAQRQATKDAGKIAGLEVKRIINEPTAAAVAYGLGKERAGETIAVYDLGGGTFDISILRIDGDIFQVLATGGDTHLGGEDFDQALLGMLAGEFEKEHGIDLLKEKISLQVLKDAAEKAKKELSSSMETEINLPFIASGPSGPLHLVRTLRRTELEVLTGPLIERTLAACEQTVKDAGLEMENIDSVVLVGGMTRMPKVQKAVEELFGKKASREVNPDEVVAIGAALQGAALSGDVEEVLLLDVTPLSIGVETAGGVMTVLIPRNQTIPAEGSETFTTSKDNQEFVEVKVFQGERKMTADNRLLAEFELSGIPPAPRGRPVIRVTIRVDANGIVTVEAVEERTQIRQSVRATPASGLSDKEVQRLVEEAEKFREVDEVRRSFAEMRNQVQTMLSTTEEAMEAYAELLEEATVQHVRGEIEAARAMLNSETVTVEELKEAYQRLEATAFSVADSIYGDDEE